MTASLSLGLGPHPARTQDVLPREGVGVLLLPLPDHAARLFSTIFGPVRGRGDASGGGRRRAVLPAGHGVGRRAAHELPDHGPVGGQRARRRHPQATALDPHAAGGLLPGQGRARGDDLAGPDWCCCWRRALFLSTWRCRPTPSLADRLRAGLRARRLGGTVLGIAYSSLGTARSIGAVVIGPMLVLQFISGVYIAFSDIPTWLQQIASVFPLKWIAQGMRSVFLPDRVSPPARWPARGSRRTALVLAAWAVVGPGAVRHAPSGGSNAARPDEALRAEGGFMPLSGDPGPRRASSRRCGGASSCGGMCGSSAGVADRCRRRHRRTPALASVGSRSSASSRSWRSRMP
jgi:hypothetical protein